MYKSAPQSNFPQQNQFVQQNPFGQFTNQFMNSQQPAQPTQNFTTPSNMPAQTFTNPSNMPAQTFTDPSNMSAYSTQSQFAQPKPQVSVGDDPFASAIRDQQNQKMMAMQKQAMASQYSQSSTTAPANVGSNNTNMTPNMFFQQMMTMMQNQGNQQNTAMMMAAMQSMMSQMNVSGGAQSTKAQPAQPESTPPPIPQTNPAFRNLFNNAATSSLMSESKPKPPVTSTASAEMTNGWGSFNQVPASSNPAQSKIPTNSFANFATDTGSTATQNDIFGTNFSNSGFSGFSSVSDSHPNPDNSSSGTPSNPFNMFKN